MTQYYSPYSAPQPGDPRGYPYTPMHTGASLPARRAGLLMMVLGGLLLLYGMCNGAATYVAPGDQFQAQLKSLPSDFPAPSVEELRVMAIVFCVIVVLVGMFLVLMGGFVRRGSRGAIITALLGVIIGTCVLGLFTLAAFVMGFASPVAFILAIVLAIPTLLFVLILIWLIQALRTPGAAAMTAAQYQSQYMQYQQMMQQYGQGGYGYGYPPPPPPQSPPPPDQTNPPPSS
jgi:hypothetical protein